MMPNKTQSENLYYSYDIKNTHFVAVNSEIPFKKQFTPEYILKFTTWLENDLKNNKQKFKIVYLHRPLYCSNKGDNCNGSAESERKLYEEILHKYNLDLVLAGHVHTYERMFPIYNSNVDTASLSKDKNTYTNPKYTTHLVCGTGGLDRTPTKCKLIK